MDAAVDQQALADDIVGILAAKHCADRAEVVRFTKPSGWDPQSLDHLLRFIFIVFRFVLGKALLDTGSVKHTGHKIIDNNVVPGRYF